MQLVSRETLENLEGMEKMVAEVLKVIQGSLVLQGLQDNVEEKVR